MKPLKFSVGIGGRCYQALPGYAQGPRVRVHYHQAYGSFCGFATALQAHDQLTGGRNGLNDYDLRAAIQPMLDRRDDRALARELCSDTGEGLTWELWADILKVRCVCFGFGMSA